MYIPETKARAIFENDGHNYEEAIAQEWFTFSMEYLHAAECLFVRISEYVDITPTVHLETELVIPARYCLNHGIELLLKDLARCVNTQNIDLKNSHDIEELIKQLNTIILDHYKRDLHLFDKNLEKIATLIPELSKPDNNLVSDLLSILNNIVFKYFQHNDPKNEFFRYPVTKRGYAGISILTPTLNQEKLKEILKDIEALKILLFILHNSMNQYTLK
jgi:hypothetical protein